MKLLIPSILFLFCVLDLRCRGEKGASAYTSDTQISASNVDDKNRPSSADLEVHENTNSVSGDVSGGGKNGKMAAGSGKSSSIARFGPDTASMTGFGKDSGAAHIKGNSVFKVKTKFGYKYFVRGKNKKGKKIKEELNVMGDGKCNVRKKPDTCKYFVVMNEKNQYQILPKIKTKKVQKGHFFMKKESFTYSATCDGQCTKGRDGDVVNAELFGGDGQKINYVCKTMKKATTITKCVDKKKNKAAPVIYVEDDVIYLKRCKDPKKDTGCKFIGTVKCVQTGGTKKNPDYECRGDQLKSARAYSKEQKIFYGEKCSSRPSNVKNDEVEVKNFKIKQNVEQDRPGYKKYKFPGCFDLKMTIILSKIKQINANDLAKQLAIELGVDVTGFGKVQCKHEHTCMTTLGSNSCYFCNLCKLQKRRHKSMTQNVNSDACNVKKLARKIPVTVSICPPDGSTEEEACIWGNSIAAALKSKDADLTATVETFIQSKSRDPSFVTRRKEIYWGLADEDPKNLKDNLVATTRNIKVKAARLKEISNILDSSLSKRLLNTQTQQMTQEIVAYQLMDEYPIAGARGDMMSCAKFEQKMGLSYKGKSTNDIVKGAVAAQKISSRVLKGKLFDNMKCKKVDQIQTMQFLNDQRAAAAARAAAASSGGKSGGLSGIGKTLSGLAGDKVTSAISNPLGSLGNLGNLGNLFSGKR